MVYEGPETQTHWKSKTVTDHPLHSSGINVFLEDLCHLKKSDGGGCSLVSCPTRLNTYFTTQTTKKYCNVLEWVTGAGEGEGGGDDDTGED